MGPGWAWEGPGRSRQRLSPKRDRPAQDPHPPTPPGVQRCPPRPCAQVFVSTRLATLVLTRLVNSLPGLQQRMRAAEFVGNAMMDNAVGRLGRQHGTFAGASAL